MPVKMNYDSRLKKLGDVISEIRHDNGVTQEQLAKKAGVSRTTLASLEKGEHNVMIKNLLDVLVALDVPLEYILLRAAEERKALPKEDGTVCSKIVHDLVCAVLKNVK